VSGASVSDGTEGVGEAVGELAERADGVGVGLGVGCCCSVQ
jgi:hypothetical protein